MENKTINYIILYEHQIWGKGGNKNEAIKDAAKNIGETIEAIANRINPRKKYKFDNDMMLLGKTHPMFKKYLTGCP